MARGLGVTPPGAGEGCVPSPPRGSRGRLPGPRAVTGRSRRSRPALDDDEQALLPADQVEVVVGARDRREDDPAVPEGLEPLAVRDLEPVVAGVPFAVDHQDADAALDQRLEFLRCPASRRGVAVRIGAEPREPLPCIVDAAGPLVPTGAPPPERRVPEREPEIVAQRTRVLWVDERSGGDVR